MPYQTDIALPESQQPPVPLVWHPDHDSNFFSCSIVGDNVDPKLTRRRQASDVDVAVDVIVPYIAVVIVGAMHSSSDVSPWLDASIFEGETSLLCRGDDPGGSERYREPQQRKAHNRGKAAWVVKGVYDLVEMRTTAKRHDEMTLTKDPSITDRLMIDIQRPFGGGQSFHQISAEC
jgi:hypothetical protein